jgi:FAD/FMN-containing dehydrogenase
MIKTIVSGLSGAKENREYQPSSGGRVMALDIVKDAKNLAPAFSGPLLGPGDPAYDEARRVHNGLIDKRPALIARCHGVADVVDAVGIAQNLHLETAVRGGGHNVAGRATVDGGVMIDLAPMKGIDVDPVRHTVRAQGGVTWGELNRETQVHGLAVTGGVVSTTGIAGLTLGGGLGWLMGKHALALDNLLSVDLVLADGRVVTASEQDNTDLFWAVRGGFPTSSPWLARSRTRRTARGKNWRQSCFAIADRWPKATRRCSRSRRSVSR